MKKLVKSEVCGPVNSARMHGSLLKSQNMWLEKKKKEMRLEKKKKERNANVDPQMWIQTDT